MTCLSRRALLAASGAGAGLLTLAACGGDGGVRSVEGAAPGDPVASLAELPVGGVAEVDLDGRRVLLVRTAEAEVQGWDAECPHQGCAVRALAEGGLGCPCHGSTFDPATGAALEGPATTGLTAVAVGVLGSDVVLG